MADGMGSLLQDAAPTSASSGSSSSSRPQRTRRPPAVYTPSLQSTIRKNLRPRMPSKPPSIVVDPSWIPVHDTRQSRRSSAYAYELASASNSASLPPHHETPPLPDPTSSHNSDISKLNDDADVLYSITETIDGSADEPMADASEQPNTVNTVNTTSNSLVVVTDYSFNDNDEVLNTSLNIAVGAVMDSVEHVVDGEAVSKDIDPSADLSVSPEVLSSPLEEPPVAGDDAAAVLVSTAMKDDGEIIGSEIKDNATVKHVAYGSRGGRGGKRGRPRLVVDGAVRQNRRSSRRSLSITAMTTTPPPVPTITTISVAENSNSALELPACTATISDGTQSSLGELTESLLDSPTRRGRRMPGNKRMVYKLTGFIIFSAHIRKRLMFSGKKRKLLMKQQNLSESELPPAMSLGDSSRLASDHWKALSEEERAEWNRRAKLQADVVNKERATAAILLAEAAADAAGSGVTLLSDDKEGLLTSMDAGVAGNSSSTKNTDNNFATPKRRHDRASRGRGRGRKRMCAPTGEQLTRTPPPPHMRKNGSGGVVHSDSTDASALHQQQQQQYYGSPVFAQLQQHPYTPASVSNGAAASNGVTSAIVPHYHQQQQQVTGNFYSQQTFASPTTTSSQPTLLYSTGLDGTQTVFSVSHKQQQQLHNGPVAVYLQPPQQHQQQQSAEQQRQPQQQQVWYMQQPSYQEPLFVAAIRQQHEQQQRQQLHDNTTTNLLLPPFVPQATRLLHSQAYATYWQNIYHPSTDNTQTTAASGVAIPSGAEAARPWERQLYHPSYYGPNAGLLGAASSNYSSSRASASNVTACMPSASGAAGRHQQQHQSPLDVAGWSRRFPPTPTLGASSLANGDDDVNEDDDSYVAAGETPTATTSTTHGAQNNSGTNSLMPLAAANGANGNVGSEPADTLTQRMWAARNLIMNKMIS